MWSEDMLRATVIFSQIEVRKNIMQPHISAMQLPLEYPAAIFPARLEWLCQPEQIERTLRLVYYLNFWKKAHDQLLYVDRQGLYEAQALVLEHAAKTGIIQVTAYLDGTHRFPGELLLESAAENAARGVLIHLKNLSDPEIWPPFAPKGDNLYRRFIRPFYRRVLGQDFKYPAAAENALELAPMREYIQQHLDKLVEQAKTTRQPISSLRLAALCVAPSDLLHIRANRELFFDSYEDWENLDRNDLRKLDPEGYSEVALQYTSPGAEFVFHLPLRRAESFMPAARLRMCRRISGVSQERCISQGQPIDAEESLQHTAREILQDLGIDIDHICPKKLLPKDTHLAQPAIRDMLWPTSNDDDDWADDPWDCICLPPNLL